MPRQDLPISAPEDGHVYVVCPRRGQSLNSGAPAAGRERRRHQRFACDGLAEVVAFNPEVLFRGEVKDVSLTGCYIATRAHLRLKRFAEIELRFSADGHQVSSLARVMEVRPGKGVGVEFLAGDPRLDEQFHRLIDRLKEKASQHP
jgi:hypothetical protein